MLRIKRVTAILLVCTMLIAANVFAYEDERQVKSNRFTSVEQEGEKVENRLDISGFKKLLSDDKIEVWYKEKNGAVRVVDKNSGYIWGALEVDKPDNMNKAWSAFANSIIALDYYDSKGIEKRTGVGGDDFKTSYITQGKAIHFTSDSAKLGIKMSYTLELDDGNLIVGFDSNTVEETSEYTIGKIYTLPFLGSTQKDEISGYMLVPDGCGALIRFSDVSSYLKGFDRRVYGADYGIDSVQVLDDLKSFYRFNAITPEPPVTTGVFGITHGVKQNALLANISSGAEYASIMATPSGVTTDYNWATAKFTLRQKYQQPTSKSGAGIQVVQKSRNEMRAEVVYSFLSSNDADYVGMAKVYRELLIEDGILVKQSRQIGDIPLKVDFINADKQKGLLFNSTKQITSFSYIESVIDALMQAGISNLDVGLIGWQSGGLSGQSKKKVGGNFSGGSKSELEQLQRKLLGKLSLYFDPITAKEPQIDVRSNGNVTLSQAHVSSKQTNSYNFLEDTYYFKPTFVSDMIGKINNFATENGYSHISFDQIGSTLMGHYLSNKVATRNQAMTLYQDAFSALSDSIDYIGITAPNDYLWKYTDGFYNIPMVSSQYLYENDTIPFLQIALKGYIDLYASYSNVDFFTELDTLKHIDFGTYPSFLLTEEKNHNLQKTTVYEYNSTAYENWDKSIVDIYDRINAVLSNVEGEVIVDRTVLSTGVVMISYSGDKHIYVNYTKSRFTAGEITVNPLSAQYREGTL